MERDTAHQTLLVRLDDAPAAEQVWDHGDGEKRDSVIQTGSAAQWWVDRLRTTARVLIEVAPFNANEVVIPFGTRGFSHHLGELAACMGGAR